MRSRIFTFLDFSNVEIRVVVVYSYFDSSFWTIRNLSENGHAFEVSWYWWNSILIIRTKELNRPLYMGPIVFFALKRSIKFCLGFLYDKKLFELCRSTKKVTPILFPQHRSRWKLKFNLTHFLNRQQLLVAPLTWRLFPFSKQTKGLFLNRILNVSLSVWYPMYKMKGRNSWTHCFLDWPDIFSR